MGIEDVWKGDSMNHLFVEKLIGGDGKLALTLAIIHSLTVDLATCHKMGFWKVSPLEMVGHPLEQKRLHLDAHLVTPATIIEELYGANLQHTMDLLHEGFRLVVTVSGLIKRAKALSAEMTHTPRVNSTAQTERASKRSDYGRKYRQFHKERLAQLQRERRNKFKMTA